MIETFLGEDVFRDGIRRYIAAHKLSNSTTADLWNALSETSGKPVGEIAAAWTEQPGFPVVKVRRDTDGKVSLSQERFAINIKNPLPLEWKIPLTYFVLGQTPQSRLMSGKIDNLDNIPGDRALKMNDVREKIAQAGSDPIGGSPEELAKFLAGDIAKWARVTKEAGIKPQ